MNLQSAPGVAPASLFVRLVRLAALVVALTTLAAFGLTIVTLIQAGPRALADFGVDSFRGTWPTALALTILVFGPAISVRLRTPPYGGISLLLVWLLSTAEYVVAEGATWSIPRTTATLIWAGTPLFTVFTVRTILALRSSMRPSAQIIVAAAIGLAFWWLTAPMAIAVTCALLTGSCP